ncbi:hypothetical protein FRC11_009889, partial [Ceratobasidium sp. 423]
MLDGKSIKILLMVAYTDHEKARIESLQQEIGWTGGISLPNDNWDNGGEWEDEEDGFVSISVSASWKRFLQTWGERLACKQYSWDQEIEKICNVYLAFFHSGPPISAGASSSSKDFSVICICLT